MKPDLKCRKFILVSGTISIKCIEHIKIASNVHIRICLKYRPNISDLGPKKDLKKLGNHGNQETKIMIFLNSTT